MAAMSLRGRVVLTFNVHRNGALTDVQVIQPSTVDSFNTAAMNALLASNPTEPLPPEYPADKAFFTVTFYYNETPGGP
jgi:TonB family protein